MGRKPGIHPITRRKLIMKEYNSTSKGELQDRVAEVGEGEGVSSDQGRGEKDVEGHRRQHRAET